MPNAVTRYQIFTSNPGLSAPVTAVPWAWLSFRRARNLLPEGGWLQIIDRATGQLVEGRFDPGYFRPLNNDNLSQELEHLLDQVMRLREWINAGQHLVLSSYNHSNRSHPVHQRLWQVLVHLGVLEDAYRCPAWIFDTDHLDEQTKAQAAEIHKHWAPSSLFQRPPTREEALRFAAYLHRLEQIQPDVYPWYAAARLGSLTWMVYGLAQH